MPQKTICRVVFDCAFLQRAPADQMVYDHGYGNAHQRNEARKRAHSHRHVSTLQLLDCLGVLTVNLEES